MADGNKPNIFQKALAAGDIWIQQQIDKGRNDIISKSETAPKMNQTEEDEEDFFYRKSVAKDLVYNNSSQGYQEKPFRLNYEHLKQMSLKDSIIAAVIQTRQNQVSGFTRLVQTPFDRGFKIKLKDEQKHLEEIKEKLKASPEFAPKKPMKEAAKVPPKGAAPEEDGDEAEVDAMLDQALEEGVKKADDLIEDDSESPDSESEIDSQSTKEEDISGDDLDDTDATDDDEAQKVNWRLERKAKEILNKKFAKRRREVEQFIVHCGKTKDRPFESLRWNFETIIRAILRDSLTYDQFGIEIIPDLADRPHHVVPVDGSTIRYSSPDLGKYKNVSLSSSYDILYPEKELESLANKDALELDPKKLQNDAYKWVQVIRGRIERAFTKDELKVGMRNPTTDIFNNGYPIAELELLVGLVSSHLNTEFYNQAYFSQGFSAKGILHIKAPLNRRKIETIRQQWQHMIKGSRNSFQTPIFAGMDEVNWIPLTQNHSDIEFQGWLQYLIKMICAIYQIDPQEIGIGMKEEGAKGNGMSGDNTQEKIDLSRDKGLYPLLRFLENFINVNIIDSLDKDFFLEFVGLKDESMQEALKRQQDEAKFKKTVNEIRAEDGLPPLPGMDDFILDSTYLQWYNVHSEKAMKQQETEQQNAMTQGIMGGPGGAPPAGPEGALPPDAAPPHLVNQLENSSPDEVNQAIENEGEEEVTKSVKIEYYTIKG
jgi:hypothetical protein